MIAWWWLLVELVVGVVVLVALACCRVSGDCARCEENEEYDRLIQQAVKRYVDDLMNTDPASLLDEIKEMNNDKENEDS